MKKILIAILVASFIAGCKKDIAIKPSESPKQDYVLPQGKSPADDRIVELYKKYNTYFLYDYSVADFNWNQIGKRQGAFGGTNADPRYVGDFLDLLQDKWFRFYPDEFLKQRMPYRIFMADSLYVNYGGVKYLVTVNPGAENLAFGYVNSQLQGQDKAFKLEYKNQLNSVFWEMLIDKKLIDLPESFFAVSSYTVNTSSDPNSSNYFKSRGFTEDFSYFEYITVEDAKRRDLSAFIRTMLSMKKSEWNEKYLGFPLLKKKYDVMQTYFLSKYKINLQLIGDAE
ncbi:hypothetical protein SAMN05421820_101445 [Pedobacter steynii]|uniref:Lipoprotein n=1 Tax=Pedobacter steynii TaxID=430522 RepID=A0A1G9K207_9SPHI|nr:hypothetical protein [Pedobacter steynii]NQX38426.1 hypothetical protein [Pedobacter steynii]SDL43877.1 hypothetical protein SAMN05421820_101445 [Pedobacter steynii]